METRQGQIVFTDGHPILNVKNVAASLDHYCFTLGFEKGFSWPPYCEEQGQTVPLFAQISRGQFSIMLAQQEQGGPSMWMYLDLASISELTALHQEYLAKAAKIIEPPTDKPWEMCEMLVEDIDGHTLRIGAPLLHEH